MAYVVNGKFEVPSIYTSAALETVSLVTGSSPLLSGGKLLGFVATNASASTAYVQLFDGYAAPSGGSVPIVSILVQANSQVSFDASVFNCIPVKSGIVLALSSTLTTYTAVSSELFVSPCGYSI